MNEKIRVSFIIVICSYFSLLFYSSFIFTRENHLFKSLFIFERERERERERETASRGGEEREAQNLKQAPGSELSA